jgi:hypothetical protein
MAGSYKQSTYFNGIKEGTEHNNCLNSKQADYCGFRKVASAFAEMKAEKNENRYDQGKN